MTALVASSALLIASPASAAPVGCTSDFYYAPSPSTTSIIKWAPDGTATTISTGTLSVLSLALNPVDGYLYALSSTSAIGNHLFRVQDDGTNTDLGAITGLPANVTFPALGFASDGAGWVGGANRYKFDIATMTATVMGGPVGGDITFLEGSLYGYSPGRIARIDPTTGTSTTTVVPGLVSFGSIWAADGHLYVSQASTVDEILGYTTATPTLLAVATLPGPAGAGDGASCSTAPSRFLAAINDDYTAAGATVAPGAVTATLTSDGGLTGTTIAPDGTLTVPANRPAGSYTLQYQLCSVATPTLCDLATVALTLDPPAATTPAAAGGASLAATGIDTLAPATGAAASIVVGLIAITIARRRRAARQ